jgi:PAS domain S-box-containing protein
MLATADRLACAEVQAAAQAIQQELVRGQSMQSMHSVPASGAGQSLHRTGSSSNSPVNPNRSRAYMSSQSLPRLNGPSASVSSLHSLPAAAQAGGEEPNSERDGASEADSATGGSSIMWVDNEEPAPPLDEVGRRCAMMVDELLAARRLDAPADATGRWLEVFKAAAELIPACVTIADMQLPDRPLVFVNKCFSETTGYSYEESVGHNCRFLQGPATDWEVALRLREALNNGEDVQVELMNHKKDGSAFRNLLTLKPVFEVDPVQSMQTGSDTPPGDTESEVAGASQASAERPCKPSRRLRYFIGIQFEVTSDSPVLARLLQHQALLRILPSLVSEY